MSLTTGMSVMRRATDQGVARLLHRGPSDPYTSDVLPVTRPVERLPQSHSPI